MIIEILLLIILIIIASLIFKFILDIGSTIVKIAVHFIAGWILLTVVNILPGIHVPINLITMAISGFGGVIGTVILVFLYLIF